jgi:hypothetical protein
MVETSTRASCTMAWQMISDNADIQDIAEPRMRLHQFARPTRAATIGTLITRNSFPSFVRKAAVLYNVIKTTSDICSIKTKEGAKKVIKKQSLVSSDFFLLVQFLSRN